jgi:hypothetical protein
MLGTASDSGSEATSYNRKHAKAGHFNPAQFENRYENALIDLLKKKEAKAPGPP